MCWSHAKIIDVNETQIQVSYKNEREEFSKYLKTLKKA